MLLPYTLYQCIECNFVSHKQYCMLVSNGAIHPIDIWFINNPLFIIKVLLCKGLIVLLVCVTFFINTWAMIKNSCTFPTMLSGLSLLLYPIIPILTYVTVLWRTPQNISSQQHLHKHLSLKSRTTSDGKSWNLNQ